MGQVVSVNISQKKGEIKLPIQDANFVENFGIEGDVHGGNWHRQVSLLAQESIDKMKLLIDENLDSGSFAENITTIGLELHTLPVGTILQIGETTQKVTQIGKHCHKHCEIYNKIGQCIMPTEGIFTEVLKGGRVNSGDEISIVIDK